MPSIASPRRPRTTGPTKSDIAGRVRFDNDHLLVEFGKSGIHGWGGFARQKLRKGKRVIEYVGEKLTKKASDRALQYGNCFVFCVNDEFDIDGSVAWNPARYLNHSCAPNCHPQIRSNRIWIYALRTIKAGEELTYNYGHDLEHYRDRPCRCGAEQCAGYIVAEEHFASVRPKS